MRLPSLFISHGSPTAALIRDDGYARSLRELGERLKPAVKAVVIVSAHGLSEETDVSVTASPKPRIIYDFRGFQPELYQVAYPCPGAPELAARVSALVADAGFTASPTSGGLDHGVWVPLSHLFPQADVPVVQVSLPMGEDSHMGGKAGRPEHVLKLGKALASLRDQGVLLIGSGSMVHNLGTLVWHEKSGTPLPWAEEFESWVVECLERRDVGSLCAFAEEAPHAALAHPTPEHFYPIFFTLGASLPGDQARFFHREVQYRSLSMSSFELTS